MILSTALWAAIAAGVTGVVALWTNPSRRLNGALAVASLHVGFWLFGLHLLVAGGHGDFWLRTTAVLMALLPAHAWLVMDAVVYPGANWRERLPRCLGWLVFGILMFGVALSDFVISHHPDPSMRYWSTRYLLVMGGADLVFVALAFSKMQGVHGVRRMEFQLLLLGGAISALLVLLSVGVGVWLEEPVILELMPLAVVAVFIGTAWALTSRRVLDARHILSAVMERLTLVAGVVLIVWSVQQLAQQFVHVGTAYVLALASGLWFAAEMHPWLKSVFPRNSRLTQLRRAVFRVARKDLRPEAMENAFVRVIKDRTQTGRVAIMMSSRSRLVGGGVDLPIDQPVVKLLQSLRWLTPERLEREKSIEGRETLQAFLNEHHFAIVVTNVGPALSFAIGLDLPRTQRPFTHPEITQLLDVVGTIETALSRARYLKQTQQAEQLATVGMLGASIAHEIRNPLVSIKTFVQLLPDHYQEAVFRDKFFRLIGDEVGRIDRMTEQLLDLSSPRVLAASSVEVHTVLSSCVDLVASKAEDKGVKLITDFQAASDRVRTDPNAVKQVILNLCFNAIQAQEQKSGERWIRIETTKNNDYVEVAVIDNGPGIAQEVWAHLFQPFQTTKSSGFGLGLAICKDILSSLQASITADPPVNGRGATFRILLPCQPPIS
jgi:signal transduction histidine kinase